MAKKIVEKTICDRCGKVAEAEADEVQGTPDDKKAPLFYIEADGKKVVELDDLCKKCEDRVNGLIEDIKLEKPAKEKKKPTNKKSKSKPKDSAADEKPKEGNTESPE